MSEDTEVGLMLHKYSRGGNQHLDIKVVGRADRRYSHPISPPHWWRSENKPYLDGLQIQGYIPIAPTSDRQETPSFYRSNPGFHDIYTIDSVDKAKAIAATLIKIDKQFSKDEVREHGDVFMAFAKAVGAKFVVHGPRCETNGPWDDVSWVWRTNIAEGRNYYRFMIAEMIAEETKRRNPVCEPAAA